MGRTAHELKSFWLFSKIEKRRRRIIGIISIKLERYASS